MCQKLALKYLGFWGASLVFEDRCNTQVLGWLTVPFYLCHQMEEHAYDFRGWRYAFVPGFNHGAPGRRFGWASSWT